MRRHLSEFIVVFLAFVFVAASSVYVLRENDSSRTVLDMSHMTSDLASYDTSAGIWSYGGTAGDDSVVLLRGPYITLPKGTYTAHVDYRSSQTNACQLNSDSGNGLIYSSNARLEPYYNGLDFDFELSGDVSDLEFAVIFTGGEFELDGISIVPNNNGVRRIFAITDIVLIIFALAFLFRRFLREHIRECIIILASAAVISLPLLYPDMSHGHDFNFHAVRIEGIAEELTNGQFPVRMSSLWVGGYGYPVSVYYGDILLYLPAVLRIFGFSINAAFKAYIIMINLLTAAISYACFKGIFKSMMTASVTTLLYVTASFRFVDCYVRTTLGELAALMFLPLIARAVYGIYSDDVTKRSYYRNAVLLAAGMTGLILTHMITTELTCFILLAVTLIMIKRTFRIQTLKCYAMAVGITVMLSMAFLVPFLHYSSSVETYIQAWMKYDSGRNIQQVGASPFELLRFWGNWFGMGNNSSERMMLSPGVLLIAALAAAAVLIIMRKAGRRILVLFCLSLFTLFLSSNLFFWDLLETLPFGEALVAIQFPWRYLGISIILLALLAGEVLTLIPQTKKKLSLPVSCISIAVSIAVCGIFTYHYISEAYFSHYVDTHSLVLAKLEDAEYLMTGTDQTKLVYTPVSSSGSVTVTGRKGTVLEVRTTTDEGASVSLPVFAYPNYVTSTGAEITRGDNNMITFDVPAGTNNVTVMYKEPLFYRIAEAVSLISAAGAVYLYRRLSRSGSL